VLFAKQRTYKSNFLLASFTALTAGMTNVAGAMACYLFTANVTGHVANFAQHLLRDKWFEMFTAFAALFMFFMGAFVASFLTRSFEHKGAYKAFALPFLIEIVILVCIGFYGITNSNQAEYYTELLAAGLLFSMGLQNGAVTIISGGSVKTTHLTGLFTDLGSEAAEWLHPQSSKTHSLKSKLRMRLTILANYVVGGLAGGFVFIQFGFTAFFCIALLLACIVGYDLFIGRQQHIANA
jgi:uncharacterized membrane protein YoaK (UPF0700 family)